MNLNILSAGAAKGFVGAVEAVFKAKTGVGAAGIFSAVGEIQKRFLAKEPCDVLILSQAMLEGLRGQGSWLAGDIAPLGVVSTAVAVRDGTEGPPISTGAELKNALASADAIYIPDPELSTAGRFFSQVLSKLDLADRVVSLDGIPV